MKQQQLDWRLIDEAASRLGVSEHARKKWRVRRKVPSKYWLEIGRMTMGKVTPEALEALRGAK
jgi:DNA-binding transcriptional regulator YdaS (Cro superfamily)